MALLQNNAQKCAKNSPVIIIYSVIDLLGICAPLLKLPCYWQDDVHFSSGVGYQRNFSGFSTVRRSTGKTPVLQVALIA